MSNICPIYSKQMPPMSPLTIPSTDKMWQIIHCVSWLDKLSDTAPNRQVCKGDYFTMESVYWSHRGWKNVIIYTWNKDKIWGQKPFKDDTICIISQYALFHTIIGLIGPYDAWNLHTDSLGNTHPLKVDKNLQWMSHHATNPTYNPVLSGTMTHSSARCLNSTTRTDKTNTCTQKVCIRYLTYCMPTLWKWFMTCNT